MILFWIGFCITEIIMNQSMEDLGLPIIVGMGVGIVIGAAIGFKIYRKIIISTEELIAQIESVKG